MKTAGGKIIRVEAHPIPEHPRPRRVKGRAALVGDAAGYVTKCSGEAPLPLSAHACAHARTRTRLPEMLVMWMSRSQCQRVTMLRLTGVD